MTAFRALPDGPDGHVEAGESVAARREKNPRARPPKPRISAADAARRAPQVLTHDEVVIPPRPPLPSLAVEVVDAPADTVPDADRRETAAAEPDLDASPDEEPADAAPAAPADDRRPASRTLPAVDDDRRAAPQSLSAFDDDVLPDGCPESGTVSAVLVEDKRSAPRTLPAFGDDVLVAGPTGGEDAVVSGGRDDDGIPVESPAALTVRGLSKWFDGTAAVDGIDLMVPRGSFFGLVGPNGAGKTTTLSMVAGLLRPDRGSIAINGIDLRAHPREAKRQIGVLPDRLETFDRLTGRQLLYYTGLLRGLAAPLVHERVADLSRAFDLEVALGRRVSDYSAGMTKKIMLAAAMIHSPRLLVLDEPFETVDPVSAAVILDILEAYVAHGGAVVLSSHAMETVQRVCSRIAVIAGGHLLAEGEVDQVRGELTLEGRLAQLAGASADPEGLEWLHSFSD